jgi:HlyD family secretion protein
MTNQVNHETKKKDELAAVLATHGRRGRAGRLVKWVGVPAVLLVTLGATAAALRSDSRSQGTTYTTEPVTRGDLQVVVSATGNLQPTNSVNVGSELSGLVEDVLVEENDYVKRGQVLARLDVSKLNDQITRSEAALASAQAKLAQADATAHEARATLERLQEVSRLSGGKVPSKTEFATAEAALLRAEAEQSSARAAVNEARAALSSDRTNLSKASIRSPIDGVVLTRSVEPGQAVAASLQVATLFTIAEDLKEMELEVDVDEADVGSVADGQQATFTVDAYPARRYTAAVTRVAYGSRTSADVVSYPTVLKVKNDDLSLRPGMTASAEIVTARVENALLVPNAALRYAPPSTTAAPSRGLMGSLMPGPPRMGAARQPKAESKDGTRSLWVLREGQPTQVTVTVGRTNGRVTEVVGDGLQEAQPVITESTGSGS